MSKRRNFKALVTDSTGLQTIGEKDTFAWNSAIVATQAIVREHARSKFCRFTGARATVYEPSSAERIYKRTWVGPMGETLQALVWEVV